MAPPRANGLFLTLICIFMVVAGSSDGIPLQKRQNTCIANNLTVDLGYSIYKGTVDSSGLYAWIKIRFAAPPTGVHRWQLPRAPLSDRSTVLSATGNPLTYQCPQALAAPYAGDSCGSLANAKTVPLSCKQLFFSEDCLFLNVFAPQNASSLPVLVYIHGGGYGEANAAEIDLPSLVTGNNEDIVAVSIQYRLGAFGFLASSTVHSKGTTNAGLFDQEFALQWVQDHICKFGGDPSRVTIVGASAGAGSVMAHILARNGTLNTTYFRNAIPMKPYLPKQFNYDDPTPTRYFNAFAQQVGCNDAATVFTCLQQKNTGVLQVASRRISGSGPYGSWTFVPVTDGEFLVQPPSRQLTSGNINGERVLSGNVAIEGAYFVPQNITSLSDFVSFCQLNYPNVDVLQIINDYPGSFANTNDHAPLFATAGDSGVTAINQSSVGTGQQQRANLVYSEATIVCPSYWIADAFARAGLASYKYQFSPPPAIHTTDPPSYSAPLPLHRYLNRDFQLAFMQMLGNFAISDNPSISNLIANGLSTKDATSPNPASTWPQWTLSQKNMMNLNETNGTLTTATFLLGKTKILRVPILNDPGMLNGFRVVDAEAWEGGRGARCIFWLQQAPNLPA